jgi:integrase
MTMGTVYPRGRKLWIGYRDVTGRWRYEATDCVLGEETKARRILAKVEAGEAAGVAHGEAQHGPVTVKRYAEDWLEERRKRGLSNVDTDAGRLKHAYPVIGHIPLRDVRPRHIRDLVRGLAAGCGPERDQLAPRTVRHVYGVLHTMFADAVGDELFEMNPCVLKRGELPKKIDKDPTWRPTAVFTKAEVEQIISDERIPEDRRILYTLLFLAGVRFGEASALRWRAYDRETRPLGRLLIATTFDTKTHKEKPVKTERPREVPTHPTLAKVLAEWRLRGWQAMFGRKPGPDDLLIPSREGQNRNVNLALTRFHEDLNRTGLRRRRQHDVRRTFITLARTDGARSDVLEWITHGPRGDIINVYTSLPWDLLCGEVVKLKVRMREGKVIAIPKAASAAGPDEASYSGYYDPPKSASSRQKMGGVDGTRTQLSC